jgi:nucleoside-diphosphate-sugar epimerase
VLALRYFTVYGPGQRPDMALHRLFASVLGGPAFPLYGDGTQIRDLTYVDDVVTATIAAGLAEGDGLVTLNVAGGTQVNLAELIDRVGDLAGRPVPVEDHDVAAGDVQRTSAAVDRAAATLGWRPAVDLDEGLRRQYEWHRSEADR